MKSANAALVIAAGILFLWVVTSGRTSNLSSAWTALVGGTPPTGTSGGAVSATGAGSASGILNGFPSAGPLANTSDYSGFLSSGLGLLDMPNLNTSDLGATYGLGLAGAQGIV